MGLARKTAVTSEDDPRGSKYERNVCEPPSSPLLSRIGAAHVHALSVGGSHRYLLLAIMVDCNRNITKHFRSYLARFKIQLSTLYVVTL